MTSDVASSGPLLAADSLGDLSLPLPGGVLSGCQGPAVFGLAPSSATCPLPPLGTARMQLGAHPQPRGSAGGGGEHFSTPSPAQPSPARPGPGISKSSLTCGQSRAGSCLLRPRSGVADKGAAATPRARRAALGTRSSAASASLQLLAWRYASSDCRRGHSPTHPGTSCGHRTVSK